MHYVCTRRRVIPPAAATPAGAGFGTARALVVHRDRADLRLRALDPAEISRYPGAIVHRGRGKTGSDVEKRACGLAPTRWMKLDRPAFS
jgi:hypothetical protein